MFNSEFCTNCKVKFFKESLSDKYHKEYPDTIRNVTIMVNYTAEAYDAIDYICMDGHLNEEGYIMCLYQYHYL